MIKALWCYLKCKKGGCFSYSQSGAFVCNSLLYKKRNVYEFINPSLVT